MEPHYSFEPTEWEQRKAFTEFIEASCHKQGISVEWLSDYWVAKLTKADRTTHIFGFHFPLNNAVASSIAKDKVATFQVLSNTSIAVVEHHLVRFPPGESIPQITEQTLQKAHLPLVVKPCDRGAGLDVYKVTTLNELKVTLTDLAPRYTTLALSPYEHIKDEFRVVLLNNQLQLMFRKLRPEGTGEWRHNLQFGAIPEAVDNEGLRKQLTTLAIQAANAINLRFGAIDIITTEANEMKVMEINAGFSLSKLAATEAFRPLISQTYDRAIAACFAD